MKHELPAPLHETTIGSMFVSLSTDTSITQTGETIIFDQVHHDPGTEYNKFTGHYRCFLNGTYVFHTTTASGRQHVSDANFHMIHNEEHVGRTLPRNQYVFLNSGSTMTLFHCTAGDSVWVNTHLYSNPFPVSATLTTFSGFLLHADIVWRLSILWIFACQLHYNV